LEKENSSAKSDEENGPDGKPKGKEGCCEKLKLYLLNNPLCSKLCCCCLKKQNYKKELEGMKKA